MQSDLLNSLGIWLHLEIARPLGTAHPRFPALIYPDVAKASCEKGQIISQSASGP